MSRQVQDAVVTVVQMLRRYAFCLTGSTDAGDDLIERCLTELAGTRFALDDASVARSLFKAFHTTPPAHQDSKRASAATGGVETALHAKVLALPLQQRQALILVRTIGFPVCEAAEILGLSEAAVKRRVLCSTNQLLNSGRSALIVEDQRLVALELRRILAGMGFEATFIASNHDDAIRVVDEARPDVILADIVLDGEKTGIDLVAEIRDRCDAPIVYVTAFPDRARNVTPHLRGAVVRKPFEATQIAKTVEEAMTQARAA